MDMSAEKDVPNADGVAIRLRLDVFNFPIDKCLTVLHTSACCLI